MSFQVNLPPSKVAEMAKTEGEGGEEADEASSIPTQKKREDWRKLKELEEMRKAGTAPAMQDEEGKDINPHIPQYIMQAPWYFGAMAPTLSHQRIQEEKMREYTRQGEWYKRGIKEGTVATKYRKGACDNCGSLTHKRKDCLERPRKVGAKFTGSEIAPDEHIQPQLDFDYDGKRDRWNGYDLKEHKRIIEDFQKVDEAKRQLKAQRLEEAVRAGELAPEEAEKAAQDDDEDADDKYADDVDMPGQKFESKQRITVRNLRIREDTAKYLYNLDVNSAHYDPKTRSMRTNPFEGTGKTADDLPYAGDNFVRWSGDAMEMAKKQLFSWEAYEKGAEAHLQADPTRLDVLTKEYNKKEDDYKKNLKGSILDKYGGEEHLEAPPKQLLLAQSEDYVEYSRQGTVIKGQEKSRIKSRFEEDIYPSNHMSVWGSFWKAGRWGYKCCHSFIKESYCTGAAGKQAEQISLPSLDEQEAARALNLPVLAESSSVPAAASTSAPTIDREAEEALLQEYEEKLRKAEKRRRKKEKKRKRKEKKRKKKKKKHSSSSESESDSEAESEDEEKKVLAAMKKEEERVKEVDRLLAMDERKRPYNLTYDFKVPAEEDMEAFKRKRMRDDDPMAQFLSQ